MQIPPPEPPGATPPGEKADDWPDWLPRTAAAEAALTSDPSAASAPPPAPRPTMPVAIPGEGNNSSWAEQRFPNPGRPSRRASPLIVAGVLLLALFGVLVTVGIVQHPELYTSQQSSSAPGTFPLPTPTSIEAGPTAAAAPTQAPSGYPAAVPAGWIVYRNATWKYTVAYPPDWFQPPSDNDKFHYFSNENVSQHGAISLQGFDLALWAGTDCLTTGGENSRFSPVISSAQVAVAGRTVTRYFDQFLSLPGQAGGWNLIANVQVGGTCLHVASFSYSRSVSESLMPTFDKLLASVRLA